MFFFFLSIINVKSNFLNILKLIPPAFIWKNIKTIPKVATLKDENGRCWHVGVEKIEPTKLYFTTGWESFVSDHKLDRGDFLLFKYIDNSSFEVKIYAKNGCTKELAINIHNYKAPKGKTELGTLYYFLLNIYTCNTQ